MGRLHSAMIAAAFAVMTMAFPEPQRHRFPLLQPHTSDRIINTPVDGPPESGQPNPTNNGGQFNPGDQPQQQIVPGVSLFVPQGAPEVPSTHTPLSPITTGSSRLSTTSSIPSTTVPTDFFTQRTTTLSSFVPTSQRPPQSTSPPPPPPPHHHPFPPSQGVKDPQYCGIFPSPGECQAAFPRYYYNISTSQCDCYLFGGCDEGVGSYRTLEECHETCHPKLKDEGPNCRFIYIDDFSSYAPSTSTSTPPVTRSPGDGVSRDPQPFGSQTGRKPPVAESPSSQDEPVRFPGPVEGDILLEVDLRHVNDQEKASDEKDN